MRVSNLTLRNFKSFKEVSVPFRPFNVIIGPNASGKSNLVQAFRFLKDIFDHGLENAVSLQGGWEFLKNMAANPDEPIEISVEIEYSDAMIFFFLARKSGFTEPKSIGINYTLEFIYRGPDKGLEITSETLVQKVQVVNADPTDFHQTEGNMTLSRTEIGDEVSSNFTVDDNIKKYFTETSQLLNESVYPLQPSVPIIRIMRHNPLVEGLRSRLNGISIYDIDPRLPKRGSPITGKADLDDDGGNLAIVLNNILRNQETKRKFHNLISDLLPHVKGASVQRFTDNSQLVALRESYMPERDIPAQFLSDGTIGLTATLVALAFEGNDLTILEEPDRNLHPRVISGLTAFMKDVSRNSQVIITTHNPEFVRYAGIENLILVHRDKEGLSQVSRPADSEILKTFLSEEIGIADMFADDFLMIGV